MKQGYTYARGVFIPFRIGVVVLACAVFSSVVPRVAAAVCGNGILEGGEECDPGGQAYSNYGDPTTGSACTSGGTCYFAFTCCKFNCQYTGQGGPCTDGNPCTSPDLCNNVGVCIGGGAAPGSCDDGNFCNGTDTCSGTSCSVHSGDPCAGGAECNNVCNETTHSCIAPASTACTGDGNTCTNDTCDGAGACKHTNNTAPCDDGIFCNGADTCSGGSCGSHSGNPCAGGAECNNVCNEAAKNCAVTAGTGCSSDGNVCTDDKCDGAGACKHTNNTAPCDDGLFCDGADTCSGGSCSMHAGSPCTGGAECNNLCNEAADNCIVTAGTSCSSDGNVCTDDKCDGAGACKHSNNTAPCDDGLFCNGGDTCSGGGCSVHAGNPCVGGAECNNVCNEAAGNCAVTAGTSCGSDGNVCTDDKCNGAGQCAHTNNTAGCDDGLFCNGADICLGGSCSLHAGDPCSGKPECNNACNEAADNCLATAGTACSDDGKVCTDDKCNATGVCTHPNKADGMSCDDSVFCNGTDACSGGNCTVHTGDPCAGNPECDNVCSEAAHSCFVPATTLCTPDNNECTKDECDGAGACGHPNKAAGTACTPDNNDCTKDQCDGVGACTHPNWPKKTPCDDGDLCTNGETCDGSGQCGSPTSIVTCTAPGDDCHNAAICNPATGLCYNPDKRNGTACGDPLTCMLDGNCELGHCVGGRLGGDSDGDHVCDFFDNCVGTPNADQYDTDGDGIGDACDDCNVDYNANQNNLCGLPGVAEPVESFFLKQVRLKATPRSSSSTILIKGVLDASEIGGLDGLLEAAKSGFSVDLIGAGLGLPGEIMKFPPCVAINACSGTEGEIASFVRKRRTDSFILKIKAQRRKFQPPLTADTVKVTLSYGDPNTSGVAHLDRRDQIPVVTNSGALGKCSVRGRGRLVSCRK